MPPRNFRNMTSPLLTYVTVGLQSPTAEATLHLKRIYHPKRSQLPPLSRASLASSSLLTPLLCCSPTFPERRCAPLHDLPSSFFYVLLCFFAALLHCCPSSPQLLFAASLLLCFSAALLTFSAPSRHHWSGTFSVKSTLGGHSFRFFLCCPAGGDVAVDACSCCSCFCSGGRSLL